MDDKIKVFGARENNLQNIDIEIPKKQACCDDRYFRKR